LNESFSSKDFLIGLVLEITSVDFILWTLNGLKWMGVLGIGEVLFSWSVIFDMGNSEAWGTTTVSLASSFSI
jgi:hypothetical protein